MPDLLVRLYALPDPAPARAAALRDGVAIRRAETWERHDLVAWVEREFTRGWAAECESAFGPAPVRCFVAMRGAHFVGFACHDVTRRNFFGPAGVAKDARGQGLGEALTLVTLAAMRDAGYTYAIIGGAGPVDFYARVAGASVIEGSTPGIYPPPRSS